MRKKIIRVAMRLFGRQGYSATSMREIAEGAKITKAALYYHFKDKETLYREAMEATGRSWAEGVEQAAEKATDPLSKLRAVVHTHLRFFVTHPDLIRGVLLAELRGDSPAVAPHADRAVEDTFEEAVRECARAGLLPMRRVRMTATLLLGGVERTGFHWMMEKKGPKPTLQLGDRMIEAAIPGTELKGKPAQRRRRAAGSKTRNMVASAALVLAGLFPAWPALAQGPAGGPGVTAFEPFGAVPEVDPVIEAIPGSEQSWTLQECVEAALQANYTLEAERRGKGELAGQMWQATAVGLPRIDLIGDWSRSRDPSFALDETFSGGGDGSGMDSLFSFVLDPGAIQAQSFWRASVDASWDINPSLIYNAVKAASLGLRRQETRIVSAEHQVAEQVIAAYHDVIRAAEQVSTAQAVLEARREFLEISRRRYRLDLDTPLDTLQAAVSMANARAPYRQAGQELRNAGSRLNAVMGRDPLASVSILREQVVETDLVSPEAAVGLALDRPDLQELALLERIYGKNRGAQKAEHRPYLSLYGSYGYVARELEDLGDDGKDSWRASASLTVPIFDGFLTKGRVEETEATLRKLRAQLEDARQQAKVEVLTLLGDLEVARDIYRAADLNRAAAESLLRNTILRYENNKADYLEVLNAEAERFQARSNLIQARYDVMTLTASLKRAMGLSPLRPLGEVEALADERMGRER